MAGCNKGPVTKMNAAAPPAQVDPLWTTYDRSQYGFKIAAPSTWSARATTEPLGLGSFAEGAPPPTPQPEPDVPPTEDMLKKNVVFRIRPKSARSIPGETDTVMFIKHEETGGSNIDDAAKELKGDIMSIVEEKRVQLPGGPAHFFRTEVTNQGGDVEKSWYFVMVNDKDVYRVEFRTMAMREIIENDMQSIMDTFRVTR